MSLYFYAPYGNRTRKLMRQMVESNINGEHSLVGFPIDVRAGEDAYEIIAVLPGVKAEDVSIQVVGDTVTLAGEFKHIREENAHYLRQERPSGKFHRTLTLPVPLEALKADAQMVDGILTLRVPKSEQALPKTIKVKSK